MDAKLKPYFDALLAHVPAGNYYAGFKLLRETEDQTGHTTPEAWQKQFESYLAKA